MLATLDDLLRDLSETHAERCAAADGAGELTFAQLDAAASAWTEHLGRLGVGKETRVGLLAGNGPAWLAAAFGVWRSGATLVPLSTFATARELGEILAHADVEVLLVQRRMRSRDFEALLKEVAKPLCLREIVHLDSLDTSGALEATTEKVSDESIACILYTSGTTGTAKGVRLSHRAILATVGPTAQRTGLGPSDLLLSTLPLFWVAGLVIRALPTLATGCGLLLVESFTPEAVLELLRRRRVTGLHLRPPQVGLLLSHRDFRPEMLAHVHRGGGRTEWFEPVLDPERTRFITGYGMTETAGYVTALDANDSREARREQLGAPLPGVEIRVVGDGGRACPLGTVGEIRVRCPGLFSGYHKQPAGTGFDAEGFFRTGDLGRVDADGLFHFDGRSKDLLRVKGINVSPIEVEGVLAADPGVEAVYVVGLPHDGLDQTVVALVVANSSASEADLRARAAEALSHYKRPEHYVFIARSDVTLGATSKPQRAALAALAATRLTDRR